MLYVSHSELAMCIVFNVDFESAIHILISFSQRGKMQNSNRTHIQYVCFIYIALQGYRVITRHHELGFRQHLEKIIPTALPELLNDDRKNQKSLKTYFICARTNIKNRYLFTQTLVSRLLELILGRKVHAESQFEVPFVF